MILCVLLKEKHEALILKFREYFPWRETVLRAHGMKSDEKPCFFIYFSLFLKKGLEIFLNPKLSLIVPLSQTIDQKGVCLFVFWFVLVCSLFLFFALFCLFVCLFVCLFFKGLFFPNCFYFSENIFFFETSINLRVRGQRKNLSE